MFLVRVIVVVTIVVVSTTTVVLEAIVAASRTVRSTVVSWTERCLIDVTII